MLVVSGRDSLATAAGPMIAPVAETRLPGSAWPLKS